MASMQIFKSLVSAAVVMPARYNKCSVSITINCRTYFKECAAECWSAHAVRKLSSGELIKFANDFVCDRSWYV